MKKLFTLILSFVAISFAAKASTVTVGASGTSFSPANVTIHVGDIVHWVFEGTHDVTSGSNCTKDNKFYSGTKNSGDTYDFTFTSTGVFPYYCSFHCTMGMTGTITVTLATDIKTVVEDPAVFNTYPNPFINTTMLYYNLNQGGTVTIDVLSASGQKVYTIEKHDGAGTHNQLIDLSKCSKGMYFLRVIFEGIPQKTAILVKE